MRASVILGVCALFLLSASAVQAAGLKTVATFNPAAAEFPEGLAIDGAGNLYVGMAPTGEIKRVTPAGAVSTFARLPDPTGGFLVGLAFDSVGNLYAALASNDHNHGVWIVTADGSTQAHVAELPMAGLPNAIAFDAEDNMFVSDTVLGTIWRVGADGVPAAWLEHDLLQGNIPPITPVGFPLGVNGIAFDPAGRNLYAVNTEFGRLLRIPVNPDGSAGAPEVLATDPLLVGADDLIVGPTGTIYIAAGVQFVEGAGQRLLSATPGGELTVLASGDPLRFPASLALDPTAQTLYITNFDADRLLGITPGDPAPALLALTLADAPLTPTPAPPPSATGGAGLVDATPSGSPLLTVTVVLATLLLVACARRSVRGRAAHR